jgi:outer membrane protein assembly factor BamB
VKSKVQRFAICLLLVAAAAPLCGSVRYVIWWKEKSPNRKTAAAFDLAAGKVVWQKQLPDVLNFVEEQPEGALVGCDDGALYLLSASDGTQLWKTVLGKEINEFHGASPEGFLVSHDKEIYWLVGRDGRVVYSFRK